MNAKTRPNKKIEFVCKDPLVPSKTGEIVEARVAVADDEIAMLKAFFLREGCQCADSLAAVRMAFYYGLTYIGDLVREQERNSVISENGKDVNHG